MCMWVRAEKGSTDVKSCWIFLYLLLKMIEFMSGTLKYFFSRLFLFFFFSLIVGRLLLMDSSIRNFQHCILLCLIARLESTHFEDFLWVSPLQMSVVSVTQLWTLLMAPWTPHARIYIPTLLKLIRKSYLFLYSMESMRDFVKDSGCICLCFLFYVMCCVMFYVMNSMSEDKSKMAKIILEIFIEKMSHDYNDVSNCLKCW